MKLIDILFAISVSFGIMASRSLLSVFCFWRGEGFFHLLIYSNLHVLSFTRDWYYYWHSINVVIDTFPAVNSEYGKKPYSIRGG